MGNSTSHESSIFTKVGGGFSGAFAFPMIKFASCFTDAYKHAGSGNLKAAAGDTSKALFMFLTAPITFIFAAAYGAGQGAKQAKQDDPFAFIKQATKENFPAKIKEVSNKESRSFDPSDLEPSTKKQKAIRFSYDSISKKPAFKSVTKSGRPVEATVIKPNKASTDTYVVKDTDTTHKTAFPSTEQTKKLEERLNAQKEKQAKINAQILPKDASNEESTAQSKSSNNFFISVFKGCFSFYRDRKIVFSPTKRQENLVPADEVKSSQPILKFNQFKRS